MNSLIKIKLFLRLKIWRWLVGTDPRFDLNNRVFHSICLIVICALGYNIPFNYLIGLKHIAILSAVSFVLFIIIYYLSRVKQLNSLALILFCIGGNALFISNFFLNSGIDGPTDLFFILTMVVMIAVIPIRYYWLLITFHFTIILTLHSVQFMNPNLVPYSYASVDNRYIDMTSAYVIVIILILCNFYFIRHNYETERKSAEQKAAMMKLLNEEKNKLFSIISHDLRAPLTNVQNYLELMNEIDLSQAEQTDIKDKLLSSTRNTLDLLNNVLSWSKSQMEGLKFKTTTLSVHELLLPQLLLFTNIAQNKKIKIEISIDHDLKIVGNGDMLQLIMRNLINNAIKFTAPGGRIIVSARQEGNYGLMLVKDTGTGKPIKLSNNIFYLNSESTKGTANEKGVGLGLVLCKEFTEVQNGQIWFECDSVSGTTFFVELPQFHKHVVAMNQ
ncbi:sensor histidine kinase [Mucilaginibacter terrae]|uniref:histidine kinase n=1 Tax=Mucilaginibacter terrae TaxID=1955052 RepID=A0ABU3GQY3_9SPHI|nr:HAMP domain-containing sensor histidine kinase [Mucilaginibacter terrae]MDT3402197.1 two-component system sensor histidine kinase/response regulator [Mucilaginibacter terrae]